jgi:molecular chaperone HtpG
MRELAQIEESALMRRLTRPTEAECRSLVADVQSAAAQSAELLSTVVMDMPLYTLHNERHVLNVIGWMESLLGDESIEKLSPLECAISLLAAYTHDLGMTLSSQEREALLLDPDYSRFRDRYVEERHLVDVLRQAGEHHRANVIENHLRTEYIRTTHSDRSADRLRRRVRAIAPNCVYRGLDYRRHLEIVAISHNHPVEWLRLQCEKEQLSWRETVGRNEPVNFACIGILLRLADLMDFDSSRTPSVLFRHLGLDADLAKGFEKISGKEWKKHLAITGIEWPIGDGPLTYRAANCPHPPIEKSVREFIKLIQQEMSQSASELRHLGDEDRFSVRLPDIRADVRPAREDGVPRLHLPRLALSSRPRRDHPIADGRITLW